MSRTRLILTACSRHTRSKKPLRRLSTLTRATEEVQLSPSLSQSLLVGKMSNVSFRKITTSHLTDITLTYEMNPDIACMHARKTFSRRRPHLATDLSFHRYDIKDKRNANIAFNYPRIPFPSGPNPIHLSTKEVGIINHLSHPIDSRTMKILTIAFLKDVLHPNPITINTEEVSIITHCSHLSSHGYHVRASPTRKTGTISKTRSRIRDLRTASQNKPTRRAAHHTTVTLHFEDEKPKNKTSELAFLLRADAYAKRI